MNGTNGTADGDDIEMDVKPKGVNGFSLINGTHPSSKPQSPYAHEAAPLIGMFKAEFCRRYGWPKEDPLEVVVDLGSRGGALNVIEKARRVMGERLGPIRSWEELPVSLHLCSWTWTDAAFSSRWKFPSHRLGDTTRSLFVPSARNKRQRPTRQTC